jgi:hypothetical protein
MSLLTCPDARPWATSIRQKVANDVVPPWHADPSHGGIRQRSPPTAEKDTIWRGPTPVRRKAIDNFCRRQ